MKLKFTKKDQENNFWRSPRRCAPRNDVLSMAAMD